MILSLMEMMIQSKANQDSVRGSTLYLEPLFSNVLVAFHTLIGHRHIRISVKNILPLKK